MSGIVDKVEVKDPVDDIQMQAAMRMKRKGRQPEAAFPTRARSERNTIESIEC